MSIREELITEFIKLCKEEFDEELTPREALYCLHSFKMLMLDLEEEYKQNPPQADPSPDAPTAETDVVLDPHTDTDA